MKDSWLGATEDGSGSAARGPLGWRPDRKTVNLLGTAAGSAGLVLIALSVFFGSTSSADPQASWDEPADASIVAEAQVSPVPSYAAPAQVMPPSSITHTSRRSYAIALPELKGLPPDASPGTEMELWVAWEPPVTQRPRIQRLLRAVVLEKIAPPAIEGGPSVALLSIAASDVSDLMWGHRYGALSVVLLPGV
ncbi:MAG: hypothetical protein ACRDI3_03445 [Actinomycetota bacterium]